MVKKLCKMINYFDRLLPIKTHDPVVAWFYELKWQANTIISLIPQGVVSMTTKVGTMLIFLQGVPNRNVI